VLISPFIRPGSVSDPLYNRYSWLRTMEGPVQRGMVGSRPGRLRPARKPHQHPALPVDLPAVEPGHDFLRSRLTVVKSSEVEAVTGLDR
jgi:hypothetical protein